VAIAAFLRSQASRAGPARLIGTDKFLVRTSFRAGSKSVAARRRRDVLPWPKSATCQFPGVLGSYEVPSAPDLAAATHELPVDACVRSHHRRCSESRQLIGGG